MIATSSTADEPIAGGGQSPPERTSLVLEPAAIEFGRVPRGEERTRTVRLSNHSDKPITLARVRSGCGCTVAALPKRTLEPDETIEVSVTIEPAAPAARSILRSAVSFFLEGIEEPVRLPVMAEVVDLVEIHPARLIWRNEQAMTVRLASTDGSAFSVRGISPAVVKNPPEPSAFAGEHEFTVMKVAWKEHGSPSQIIFTSDHPEAGAPLVRSVAVREQDHRDTRQVGGASSTEIVPALQLRPRRMSFGAITADAPVRRTVMAMIAGEDELCEGFTAEVDHEGFAAGIDVEVESARAVEGGIELELIFHQRPGTIVGADHSPELKTEPNAVAASVPGGPVRFDVKITHGAAVGLVHCTGILVGVEGTSPEEKAGRHE